MTVRYVKGDLFATGADALAHGCNCRGLMGAGIAAEFARRWPDMYKWYARHCTNGRFTLGDVFDWPGEPDRRVIYNLATQYTPGPSAKTWAISAALGRMVQLAWYQQVRTIAMPQIGCGIGGLTTHALRNCLWAFEDAPVDLIVVEYQPRKR